ncbi:MAG TPA: hypothetical protein VFT45_27540 [Longimicrobium sp.]|nr:hypothetical protein [Longimicrobium sp.]
MRVSTVCLAGLLCLGACGNEENSGDKSTADETPAQSAGAPSADSALPAGVSPAAVESGTISSVYTSLEKDCRLIEVDEESESSAQRCPGTAGYELKVMEGDLRMSIDIITPDGQPHELNYWSVITSGFSSLGPRAEWRMRGGRPIALIVRVNASENPENASQLTSYLAVAKITPREICVTDRIAPAPNANEAARAAADSSAGRTCITEVP